MFFSETFNSSFPVRPGSPPQKRKHKPWMTNGLVNACNKKNLLYKRFLTSRFSTSEIRYNTYKNKITSILRYCEKQYYSDLLKANKNNTETWKIINDLLNKKSSTMSSYPTEFMKNGAIISGNMNIAEHFNSFFANIGPTLAEGIPKSDRHVESFWGDRVTDSIFLNPVTGEELLNIVHNAKDKKKSKGYDGIDMCMLKKSFRTSQHH